MAEQRHTCLARPGAIVAAMRKPATPTAQVLSDNIKRLIGDRSVRAWAGDPTMVRNVSRIINQSHSPTVSQLEEIASRAGVQVWHLLLPGFDPQDRPVATMTESERIRYRMVRDALVHLPPA